MAEANYFLSCCYYQKDQPKKALTPIKTALDINPKEMIYLVQKLLVLDDLNENISDLAQHIIDLPLTTARDYLARGRAYAIALKQYDDAIKDYTKAIDLNPEYAIAYYNRGNAKSKLKQYDDALKDYTKAIVLSPEYANAYYNRGTVKSDLKQYDDAIKDYTKAIALNPEHANAYHNRGTVKSALKQYDDAIKDYTKAIALNTEFATAYNNRALTYDTLKQYDDAYSDIEKALELDPDNETYKNFKERLEFRIKAQKDIDETEEKLEKVYSDTTAFSILERDANYHAKWRFKVFVGLRTLEILIYAVIIGAVIYFHEDFFKFVKDNKDPFLYVNLFILKLSLIIPTFLMLRLINKTANRFAMRSELDADSASRWKLFNRIDNDLKSHKGDASFDKMRLALTEETLPLLRKTNFERIEEILKTHTQTPMTKKHIDGALDTLKNAKDILTPDSKDDKKKTSG